jgi:hypothetical protein
MSQRSLNTFKKNNANAMNTNNAMNNKAVNNKANAMNTNNTNNAMNNKANTMNTNNAMSQVNNKVTNEIKCNTKVSNNEKEIPDKSMNKDIEITPFGVHRVQDIDDGIKRLCPKNEYKYCEGKKKGVEKSKKVSQM